MRHRTVASAAFAGLLSAGVAPASGVEAGFGISGYITVFRDLGACATVTLSRPVTATGELSAVGAVAGPGSAVAPVRGATPFVISGTTSWYGCLPDAYAGASAGSATYTLAVSSVDNDFAAVLACDVRNGAVSCR